MVPFCHMSASLYKCHRVLFWFYSHTFVSHISLFTTRSGTGCCSGFTLSLSCHMSASFTWTWWRVAQCYSGFALTLLRHISASLLQGVAQGALLVSLSHFCVTSASFTWTWWRVAQCYSGFALSPLDHMSASLYQGKLFCFYSILRIFCFQTISTRRVAGSERRGAEHKKWNPRMHLCPCVRVHWREQNIWRCPHHGTDSLETIRKEWSLNIFQFWKSKNCCESPQTDIKLLPDMCNIQFLCWNDKFSCWFCFSLSLSLSHTHTHTHRDSNKAQKMDEKFLYFFLTHIHTDKTTDTWKQMFEKYKNGSLQAWINNEMTWKLTACQLHSETHNLHNNCTNNTHNIDITQQ